MFCTLGKSCLRRLCGAKIPGHRIPTAELFNQQLLSWHQLGGLAWGILPCREICCAPRAVVGAEGSAEPAPSPQPAGSQQSHSSGSCFRCCLQLSWEIFQGSPPAGGDLCIFSLPAEVSLGPRDRALSCPCATPVAHDASGWLPQGSSLGAWGQNTAGSRGEGAAETPALHRHRGTDCCFTLEQLQLGHAPWQGALAMAVTLACAFWCQA